MNIRSLARYAPVATAVVLLMLVRTADVQPASGGGIVSVTVHGVSLEGNLSGEPADRNVMIYLPPSYDTNSGQRYPVVYLLHGFLLSNSYWTRGAGGSLIDVAMALAGSFVDVEAAMARNLERGTGREMILVMPDARTDYGGSMYSTSITTGDWERFIAEDLVGYVDANYRTLASRENRGIAGHSMGGYGALRIGMKHPDVFSSLYSLSACCLIYEQAAFDYDEDTGGEIERVIRAVAAAWSPNPADPPEFFDRPGEDGVDDELIAAKWAANSPLAIVDQYVPNLRRYNAIALDVGSEDTLKDSNEQFAGMLEAYDLAPVFEVYEGDHVDRIDERFGQRVIPFFSESLSFD